jgi:CBS domain containing-hemolysin-like protein
MGLARVRRTRMDQLAEEGNLPAKLVQKELDDPDRFISACQLGITLATLGLGFVGESTFANDLAAWVQQTETGASLPFDVINVSKIFIFAAVFVLVAYVQTVLGELLPKTITFQRAEEVALRLSVPMNIWCNITSPFIHILNGSTDFLLRLLHIEEPPRRHFVHTEEELKMLVSASHEEGVLEPEEEEMLHSVFDFSDTVASEVMTPRTDMICVSATATVHQFVELALEHGHSRIPIYEQDLDNIFGLVHIRDGLRAFVDLKDQSPVRELVKKVLIVPENKNLGDLLAEFKKTKTHMAIIIDEYGGTRGMVTLEDLLEELVGDIADEHEIVEEFIQELDDGTFMLDAKIPLDDLDEKLGLEIEDEEFNTLGGHVFGQLGREPQPGDEVQGSDYTLRVEESDRHRIIKLRLIKHKPGELAGGSDGNGNMKAGDASAGTKETPRSVEAG